MWLEIKFNQSSPIVNHRCTQLLPENPRSSEENSETQKSIQNHKSRGKTPGNPFESTKCNATYSTGRCDVIIFSKNAIQSNAVKQYLEIAATWPHCLSSPLIP